ncbi:MAG: hypothetical protein ACYCXP_00810 [Leptospirillum sp.]
MSENPTSGDDLHKLAEQGQKFLEKRRRNASQYRKKLKEEGIDSTILRIKKEDLDKIRAMADIEGTTLNGMLEKVIRQGICWRREVLEEYVKGKISQGVAVNLLGAKNPSTLSQLLALEGLPIPMK